MMSFGTTWKCLSGIAEKNSTTQSNLIEIWAANSISLDESFNKKEKNANYFCQSSNETIHNVYNISKSVKAV